MSATATTQIRATATAVVSPPDAPAGAPAKDAVAAACARIAPTWPLDALIAVNPLWGFVERPMPEVAGRLAALSGARLLMPRAWFREQWRAGRLAERHLRRAVEARAAACTPAQLVALLDAPDPAQPRRALVTDVIDEAIDTIHGMSWTAFVRHAIGQTCAAHFDAGQAQLGPSRDAGLYPGWLEAARCDLAPRMLMGLKGWRAAVHRLPHAPRDLVAEALAGLDVPASQHEAYLTALLLQQNGWASWCAYRRWQARLAGGDDPQIEHLLAIRLAWEWLLYRTVEQPDLASRWKAARLHWPAIDANGAAARSADWLLQEAMEIAYREPLCRGVRQATGSEGAGVPDVQAVFCIDVRSEPYRRALESTAPGVRTLGFAGFFGLPIAYRGAGTAAALPQLPGLLAPTLLAADADASQAVARRRRRRFASAGGWTALRGTASSAFSFVESFGLFHAGRLAQAAFGRPGRAADAGLLPGEHGGGKPRLGGTLEGGDLPPEARADLAAGMLRAMSLTRGHARLVLLVGHGSSTTNNPHAAALHCGACGGRTGEVNARVAAALLNDAEVRAALPARGVDIPPGTVFLAGLHDTTTDDLALFDLDEVPASHREDVARLQADLAAASDRARAARVGRLGVPGMPAAALRRTLQARGGDWSEVRPEWGLAGCAALIVAPRARTRHLDLEGRAFLHEYRWQDDPEGAVLEGIMTAPMIVAHWINLQYYASTVDNRRYGSGDKVLHNVVGGRLGVFEGNGGDLRIGLPMQSLHDGSRWVHTPLRLAVFVEAPAPAIDRAIARHEVVRDLVENGWLHLLRIDTATGAVSARRGGTWVREGDAAADSATHAAT